MIAARAAITVLGLSLLGSASVFAQEADRTGTETLRPSLADSAVSSGQVELPSLPDVAVSFDDAPVAIALPALPEVEVRVEAPVTVAAPAPIEIEPPALPAITVALPLGDLIGPALAERLADTGAPMHRRMRAADREALLAFYALGDFKPLWIAGTADAPSWTGAANRVIARLRAAGEDALDPSDYAVPALGVTARESISDLVEAELELSVSAVLYARDARGGRIDPRRFGKLVTPKLDIPAPDHVLTVLAAAPDAGETLGAYNPPHAEYRALKARLAELRANRPSQPMVRVPAGPSLKVGMSDPRVPLIRARFGLGASEDERLYDRRVASAVADFQRDIGLKASGVLTPRTAAALGESRSSRTEGDLVANMERWRWLPADLGDRHIFVNVPDYTMKLMDGADVVHEARVIVGKAQTPTPLFSDEMEHLIVNPYWTIPPSILRNEILPGLAADPDYAAKRGYEVIRRGDRISVRQPPGERNALGLIKFMFPNDHAVYLHDTPNRSLFGNTKRAYSHGCVRVDKPFELAEFLLRQEGWTQERLKKLVGRGERLIRLEKHLPVHLAYFTIRIGADGRMRTLEDLYGLNQKVREALGING